MARVVSCHDEYARKLWEILQHLFPDLKGKEMTSVTLRLWVDDVIRASCELYPELDESACDRILGALGEQEATNG